MRNEKVKRIAMLAVLAAFAYISVALIRIPIVSFLKYEPKDVFILLGGFIFGPLASMALSVGVSLLEMITVSDTGIIGFIMNVISTCSFAVVAALIYKYKKNIKGTALGLICGVILMSVMMLGWNYFITPIYMKVDRETIAAMLLPVFLPFNLFKGLMNSAITLLLYKPLVTALRKTNLLPAKEEEKKYNVRNGIIVTAISVSVVIICILFVIFFFGK